MQQDDQGISPFISVDFVHESKYAKYVMESIIRKIDKSPEKSRLAVHTIDNDLGLYESKFKKRHYFLWMWGQGDEQRKLIYLQHVINWAKLHEKGYTYTQIANLFDYPEDIVKALVEFYNVNSYLTDGLID